MNIYIKILNNKIRNAALATNRNKNLSGRTKMAKTEIKINKPIYQIHLR